MNLRHNPKRNAAIILFAVGSMLFSAQLMYVTDASVWLRFFGLGLIWLGVVLHFIGKRKSTVPLEPSKLFSDSQPRAKEQ